MIIHVEMSQEEADAFDRAFRAYHERRRREQLLQEIRERGEARRGLCCFGDIPCPRLDIAWLCGGIAHRKSSRPYPLWYLIDSPPSGKRMVGHYGCHRGLGAQYDRLKEAGHIDMITAGPIKSQRTDPLIAAWEKR